MFLYPLFYWRQLHVVAEEVAEILVVFCRQKYGGVFEGEWFAVAKPCLREDFAFMIGACVNLYVLCFVEVVEMTQMIHFRNEMSAHEVAEEEGCRLDDKTSPGLTMGEQCQVFAKGVSGGNGVEAVDVLHIFALQCLGLFHIVGSGIKWEDVDEESDDARALFLLDECGVLVDQLGEIERVTLIVVGRYHLVVAEVFVACYLKKAVVVGAWHDDVDVIVPGYHTMMAHSPYGCSCTAVVAQVVCVADTDECLQYVEYGCVPFFLDILDVHCLFVLL